MLEAEKIQTTTAGRVLAIRSFGKANFLVISDGAARIQVYVRKDALSERDFAIFKLLDFGDFVGVEGHLFRTKTNELTIWATQGSSSWPSASSRCPRSGTGCRTSRSATASATSISIVNPDSRRVFEVRSRVLSGDSRLPRTRAATSRSRRR